MNEIDKRQLAKKRQLLQLKRILDDMDVMFWLHSGVLLGYYREHNLIPHDPDLDLGVLRSQLPEDFSGRFARRLENTGMRLFWKTRTCLKIMSEDKLSHCDIFIHDGDFENGLTLALEDGKQTVRYEYPIKGFAKVKFLGAEFLVPSNPREILFRQYGPSWKTPKTNFKWDKDPCNITGKPTLVLDETPAGPVLSGIRPKGFTAVFGPITVKDAGMLAEQCDKAVVFSEQPGMSVKNVEFYRCDETHGAESILYGMKYRPDMAIVSPTPGQTDENMRTMLDTAWRYLKDGGDLVFCGQVPDCVSEFMFEKKNDTTFTKHENPENWEEKVTAVIVTYESHALAKKCVESIKKFHPAMRVVLVDNSANPKKIDGTRFVPMPKDAGLSASRNAGVLEVHTPYVLLTDDDQILEDGKSVKKMYDSVINNNLDIVGGAVINSQTGISAAYYGKMHRSPRAVVLNYGHRGLYGDGTWNVDIALNFFVAKTDILKKVKWTDELKIGSEHLDFFLRAKEMGVKVGHLKAAKCKHEKNQGSRSPSYKSHRGWTGSPYGMMMRLNGLDKIKTFNGDVLTPSDNGKVLKNNGEITNKPKCRTNLLPQYRIVHKRNMRDRLPRLFKRKK